MAEVVLKNIYKTYGENVNVVKDFNLAIEEKEFIVFVGPSGCGKSTTLRMIAGLEDISEGELYIKDKFANYLEPGARDLAMVFQNYALYPTMSVYENIAFSLRVRKVKKEEVDKKVREVAKLLDLTDLLPNRPKELSGGQRQRVAIGNAIVRNPEILLMDEPLSNLDAKLRTQMRVELANLHKKLGNIVIYVTHDQVEAMTLGTRIVVMKDGVIQQVDAPKKLYENPRNKFVATFIGSPSMNVIQGRIQIEDDNMLFLLEENGVKYRMQLPENVKQVVEKREARGNEIEIGIRPEKISNRPTGNNSQSIEVEIEARELLGSEINLYFRFKGVQMVATVSSECQAMIGDRITLYLDMEGIAVFDKHTEENYMHMEE